MSRDWILERARPLLWDGLVAETRGGPFIHVGTGYRVISPDVWLGVSFGVLAKTANQSYAKPLYTAMSPNAPQTKGGSVK